ncbi:MAG: phosphoribosylformylglycinamidine synthase I [Methanocalculus sp. MSAO_Arc2]|uniref:phosphoribosylformylglycinamidine synthase I n=1 Tax=Methanocalculus sp. MSAO_Arc2 TaxID=2293855 RepID=UPI000FED05FF|nr:MAG: phosphoribosylformylglycinamidine synthase I [Methanocalculus sp. MSAO_Arc2]
MRSAVIQFGGSNCDHDVAYIVEDVCGADVDLIWYKDGIRRHYDAIILPGGFSYGDYLRAGAIAARTPVMADLIRAAGKGVLVLGICNGAQIAAESGLIPGIFTTNAYPKFICRPAYLRVENTSSPFTRFYTHGEVVKIPIAHKEGRYIAPNSDIRPLEEKDRIAFRFCDEHGEVTGSSNPNGSAGNITGILSENENVLVMMPHPERASEAILGSTDGKKIFDSMIAYTEES